MVADVGKIIRGDQRAAIGQHEGAVDDEISAPGTDGRRCVGDDKLPACHQYCSGFAGRTTGTAGDIQWPDHCRRATRHVQRATSPGGEAHNYIPGQPRAVGKRELPDSVVADAGQRIGDNHASARLGDGTCRAIGVADQHITIGHVGAASQVDRSRSARILANFRRA